MRKFIENRNDYLSAGLYRCKVYDHFYVKRCNKCQEFGHYRAQCKSSHSVCANCCGDHESINCEEKSKESFIPSCKNCEKSKNHSTQHDHLATDRTCPFIRLNNLNSRSQYHITLKKTCEVLIWRNRKEHYLLQLECEVT